ncbi:serine hydrolase [Mucilaginibacter sp. KACC 22773]|uniref:serine hydrolase domain-containing protein n=1 Tax=Mucilaginibacter sp. KACC 22773 TaxID=3025671 RepID=UPI00236551BE|nr:serine hydrolase domain-containing protein [Mucilaginibacter sp. KACC 22773]WDF77309.1 serine hydrolase [Mucilaginibacter sp. KACC 22773]
MKRLSLFAIILLIPILTKAQIDRARLDSLFHYLSTGDLAIGSLTITQNGKMIYQRSFGKDQNPSTEYRIGSITKVFTAILTYQLIDGRRLTLSDRLSLFFPGLPNADKVTVAQLLGHRSGLANFTNNTDFDTWKDQPKTHAELLEMISRQKPDFEPDAKADYNNSNYLLLGYIAEKLYGQPYQNVVTNQIIRPLGLKHTYYGEKVGFMPGEATSYKYFDSNWKPDRAVCLDNFGGAGALISTPRDLCSFITALFSGKLISAGSLAIMKTMRDGYGKGLFPYGDALNPGFGHNGKTEGFGSSMQYYPKEGLAIAYCTNGEVFPKARILDHIFKACFHISDTLETFQSVQLDSTRLSAFTGTYSAPSGMQVVNRLDKGKLLISVKGKDFELTAISPNEFWNKPFGFFFYFDDGGKRLLLQDVGDVYELHRP